jgi:serine/threonine protein phosphatase PrpC
MSTKPTVSDLSLSSEDAGICPVCGTHGQPGDHFCELDGAVLEGDEKDADDNEILWCDCGAGKGHDGGDGFCDICGMKLVPAVADGEALAPAPDLGAATHVGRSHDTDEDAVRVARIERDGVPVHAIVVCDGVSSSSHGEEASAHAAEAALAVLTAAIGAPGELDCEATMRAAIGAAHRAACEAVIAAVPGKDPPGTTIVAAIATTARIDVGWVGDSRAYLLAPDGATALTHDHSWVNQMVDSGAMTEDEATRSRYAHALTHCIGPLETTDAAAPPPASVGHVLPAAGSHLIVCSDGLWNYAPQPTDIADAAATAPADADARAIAWTLVHHALALGGHDDVTVAVALL